MDFHCSFLSIYAPPSSVMNSRCFALNAERPGSLEVDGQVEFGRTLDRQIGGFRTLEYLVNEGRRPVIGIGEIDAAGKQTARPHKLRKPARGKPPHGCKDCDRVGVCVQASVLVNHERTELLIGHSCEDPGELIGLTRLEGAHFY